MQDYNKTIAAILPVASKSSSMGYELWVGQSQNTIAIIDASTLQPIKYLSNDHDNSLLPQYLSDSYISHFAIDQQSPLQVPNEESSSFLYSALFSGQVVTRWCPVAKIHKAAYNVSKCMGELDNYRVSLFHHVVHDTASYKIYRLCCAIIARFQRTRFVTIDWSNCTLRMMRSHVVMMNSNPFLFNGATDTSYTTKTTVVNEFS